MVGVALHGACVLVETMVAAAMPWLLESYGELVGESGLETYGAGWFASLVAASPVIPGQYQFLLVATEIVILIPAYLRLPRNDARPLADAASR